MAAFAVGCGGSSPSVRPSQSLVVVDFSPPARSVSPSASPSHTPVSSLLPASWPVGWDVAFCNAFADTTVAHELVIDIERAIADDNREDAAGLANELAQTVPIAANETARMSDWTDAADLQSDLTNILDLDAQAAAAYQSYFNDAVKSSLRSARQLRNQVGKQVDRVNDELQQLTNLGLSCPGTDLKLEKF